MANPTGKGNEEYNRRAHEAAAARAQVALRMRAQKCTWTEIGAALGVTRQRAQALAKAHSRKST